MTMPESYDDWKLRSPEDNSRQIIEEMIEAGWQEVEVDFVTDDEICPLCGGSMWDLKCRSEFD